ncbi:MAG: hypothetical protein A4E63_01596 [Syntrophorhabdus sp. PtaU1.Bin050]|jgi:hypothetical protein|nr:MAG: hypothetical protein A4E63_01596 [Syntrophorhabdus sp. PtaU1.Bin050]
MTAKSYELYHAQYRAHLDELLVFLGRVGWDLDHIEVAIQGRGKDAVVLLRRHDKTFRFNILQYIGLLRLSATKEQTKEVLNGKGRV